MRAIGLLIASIPFWFAAVRAVSTGSDFRYAWVAVASTFGAAGVLAVANRARSESSSLLLRTAFAIIAALVASAATSFVLGATSVPALIVVALGFATCSAVGLALAFRGAGAR